MMEKHALFPTLVGEWHWLNKDKFKDEFFSQAFNHLNSNGYSTETTGHVDIHHNPVFDSLWSFSADCAGEYLKTLQLKTELFSLNLIKTWLNIIKEWHTPMHNHADAHLSFVYYVHIPEGVNKPIYFSPQIRQNELFHSIYLDNVNEWNIYNSGSWYFEPKEGQLFMFPANLHHHTGGYGSGEIDKGCKNMNDLLDRRISIAGDFLLTYNKKIGRSYGIQPVSNWRTFNV